MTKELDKVAAEYAASVAGEIPLTPYALDKDGNLLVVEYYALVGDDRTVEEAYGLIRKRKTLIERWNPTKKEWVEHADLFRYFNGDNNDAVEIGEEEARTLTERLV